MRALFLLILAITLLAPSFGAVPSTAPSAALHFDKDAAVVLQLQSIKRALLTADIRIDGQDAGLFLINTAAASSLIDSDAADRLHLPVADARKSLRSVDSIRLGSGVSLDRMEIPAVDLSSASADLLCPVAGVLGQDVLAKLDFTLDYRESTLTVFPPTSYAPPAGASKIPFVLMGSEAATIPCVDATIDNVSTRVCIDTGSNLALTLYPAFTDARPAAVDRFAGHIHSAQLGASDMFPAQVNDLVFLGQTFHSPRFSMAIVRSDRASGPLQNDVPAGAGALLLQHFRLTFDNSHHLLWVEPSNPLSIRERLSRGMKPNTPDISGRTLLMDAASVADVEGCKLLMAAGADSSIEDAHGISAIQAAAETGSGELIKLFLASPAGASHINAKDPRGQTALMRAASASDPTAALALLDAGADVTLTAKDGRSAIHFAAAHGNTKILAALLAHHADANALDHDSYTPLECTLTDSGSPDAYDALFAAGARLSPLSTGTTPLHIAASAGTAALVDHLLKDKQLAAQVSNPDRSGETPLTLAARAGHTAVIALLLDHGAVPTQMNQAGIEPIHYAAELNKPELIQVLIAHHADPNARTREGGTALMIASLRGRTESLMALLDAHADPNLADPEGGTALQAAVVGRHVDAIRLLIQHGADLKAKNKQGYTAEAIAKEIGDPEVIAALKL